MTRWFPLILLCFGCAGVNRGRLVPATISASSFAQPMSVIAPRGSITVVPRDVSWEWNQSTNSDGITVDGYNLYYGTESRFNDPEALTNGYPNVIHADGVTNTTAMAMSLKGATTYYFSVTAVSQDGVESDFSEEVTNTTPLVMDLDFQFDKPVTNVSVQISTDLMTWQASNAQLRTNGLWRVDAESSNPVEFYRGIGQVVPAL